MIYTPATVYYRLELVRGYHLFAFLFSFPPSRSVSRALRLSLSPLELSRGHPHTTSRILHN